MLQEDDGVSGGQVEPQPAHVRGQQHHVDGGVSIEALHQAEPLRVLHSTVQSQEADIRRRQYVALDNVQEASQLRKDENPVSRCLRAPVACVQGEGLGYMSQMNKG